MIPAATLKKAVEVYQTESPPSQPAPKRESPRRKEAQGQALSLPTIELWNAEVDGEELLDEIAATFRRFIVLPDDETVALALWVMHAHAIDAAQISPLLLLTSAEKRCGKTNCGQVVGALSPRAISAANLTSATLFRTMETFNPTLIADEVDTYLDEKNELRGLINSGHVRSSAYTIRTTGENFEPRLFSTWGAKVLIGIRATTLRDTTVDRAIVVELKRRTAKERVEQLRLDRLDGICRNIRRQAARWVADHIEALREADPRVPASLNDRAADNWRPLLAIADEVGSGWPEWARDAARGLSGAEDFSDDSTGVQLLADFSVLFNERERDRIPTAEALTWLHQREGSPWSDWYHGQPITARRLAGLLKPFGIKPDVHRVGDTTFRGYVLKQFGDAFDRYLPPQSVTSVTPKAHNDLHDSQSVTGSEAVTDGKAANSLCDNSVTDVTDTEGVYERDERAGMAM